MSDFRFQQHLNWRSARRLARWLAAYAAACALMLLPSLLESPSPPSPARITAVTLTTAGGETSRDFLGDVSLGGGRHGVLRINLHAAEAPPEAPQALYLAGVFSARVTLNGVELGTKGAPGPTRDTEQPGPIDVVLPIPPNLLRQGENELVLDISAHAIGYPVESVFHSVRGDNGISIGPYSSDARRPIAQYAAPFLMLSVLALALVALAVQGALRQHRWEALLAAALLVAAGAEMARAFVAYPYPMHGARMGALTLALGAASLSLTMIAAAFAEAPQRWRIAAGAAGVLVLVALTAGSFDGRLENLIKAGAAMAVAFAAWGIWRNKRGALPLLAALLFVLGLALFLDDPSYLDSTLYASMLPLLALLTFSSRGPAPEVMEKTPNLAPRVAIGGANRRRITPLADIKALHGAGNYAEFELISGERVLDERKLADWSESLPVTFFRVHRSHIVNLEHTRAVLTLGAGKYEVEMTDRTRVPLARGRVGELRCLIESMGVLPGAATAE